MLQEIRRILWEEWDPIGVNGIAPDDEYDSYAFRVFSMLSEEADVQSVADYLRWAAAENMGLGGAGRDDSIAEDAQQIASKIIALRKEMQ